MGLFRAAGIITALAVATPPLMVLQWLFLRLRSRHAVTFPHVYHRNVCRLIGARIETVGTPHTSGPCLMASNHCSWLDITIMSAIAPVSFVAKKEVARWPIFGQLARLQRTVFVERERRSATGRSAAEMKRRLEAGDVLVLFPEGTSSDGNRVLPFKSALMGAAELRIERGDDAECHLPVQPVSIAYTGLHGLPMGRQFRPFFTWYGAMEMVPHIWHCLRRGPFDVVVQFHPPVTVDECGGRKPLAQYCETRVRAGLAAALTGRPVETTGAGSHGISAAVRSVPAVAAGQERADD